MTKLVSEKSNPEIRIRFILWMGIFSTFIYNPPRTIDSLVVGPLELFKGGAPFIAIMLGFFNSTSLKNNNLGYFKNKRWLIPLPYLLFILWCFSSSIWSENALATLLKSFQYLGVTFCIAILVSSYTSLEKASEAIVNCLHLICILGIFQWIIGIPSNVDRYNTVFPAITSNLVPLVYFVPLCALILNYGFKIFQNAVIKSSLLLCYIFAILASGSRIATVLIALITFSILIRIAWGRNAVAQKTQRGILLMLLLATPVFVSLFSYSESWQSSLNNFLTRNQNQQGLQTLTGRTVVWEYSREYLRDNWILGGGYYSGHRYALGSRYSLLSQHSNLDNTWLEVLVNLGVLGFVIVFSCFLLYFFYSWRIRSSYRFIYLGYGCALFGISFFNPTIQQVQITQVIFLYLAFVAYRNHRIVALIESSNLKDYRAT